MCIGLGLEENLVPINIQRMPAETPQGYHVILILLYRNLHKMLVACHNIILASTIIFDGIASNTENNLAKTITLAVPKSSNGVVC